MQKEQKVEALYKTHTCTHTLTHTKHSLFLTHLLSHSLFHSLCHPVSVLARELASTRAGRCSKTSYYFVPALLYPSGCAFKFPHLLLFTLSSSRAGTLSKIHTCTHMRRHTQRHTHTEFYLCADDAVLQLCEAHTRHSRGVFLSLPPFSFSIEQAKSRGSAGLWRVEAANFL